jgi:regulatory protein
MALRYVERFATTRGKLRQYLARKIRERGWAEGVANADPQALAERLAELGYIDDAAFGEARAMAMGRRGLGARRVTQALRHAGLEEEQAAVLRPAIDARGPESAVAFARRRRIGPFAAEAPDTAARAKAISAMIRAGHGFDIARTIVAMAPGDPVDDLLESGNIAESEGFA